MKAFLFVVVLVTLELISGEVCSNGRRCSEGTTCCDLPNGETGCCPFIHAYPGKVKAPNCGLSPSSCDNNTQAGPLRSVPCQVGGWCSDNSPICCLDNTCCSIAYPICCCNKLSCCPSYSPICCTDGCCTPQYPICCGGKCCSSPP